MSVTIKSPQEIELMREAGKILAKVHEQLGKELKPGMSTLEVDRLGEEMIRSFGCEPSFKGYQSDAARTHGVGEISDDAKLLIERTRQSFFEGIKFATAGNHLHQISAAIGDYAGSFGYGVVRDLCGHGIGKHMHEDPEIPNFRQFRRGIKLRPGMTLAIEPMVDLGSAEVVWMDDDWTVVTEDWSLSAHYENTILITDGEPEIFTLTESEIATGRWNQYLGRQTEA